MLAHLFLSWELLNSLYIRLQVGLSFFLMLYWTTVIHSIFCLFLAVNNCQLTSQILVFQSEIMHEARVMMKLDHHYIVRIIGKTVLLQQLKRCQKCSFSWNLNCFIINKMSLIHHVSHLSKFCHPWGITLYWYPSNSIIGQIGKNVYALSDYLIMMHAQESLLYMIGYYYPQKIVSITCGMQCCSPHINYVKGDGIYFTSKSRLMYADNSLKKFFFVC